MEKALKAIKIGTIITLTSFGIYILGWMMIIFANAFAYAALM